jgi:hypothetical protein
LLSAPTSICLQQLPKGTALAVCINNTQEIFQLNVCIWASAKAAGLWFS